MRSLTPSPALCSQSHPAAQPSSALGRRWGQKGQRTCSATLPRLPAWRTIQKAVAHHKDTRHQWTRRCWEHQAPLASPLALSHCSFAPPKRCSAATTLWPGWLPHMAPQRKGFKTSLKHLCDHESSGSDTLHPPLIPGHMTVTLQCVTAVPSLPLCTCNSTCSRSSATSPEASL